MIKEGRKQKDGVDKAWRKAIWNKEIKQLVIRKKSRIMTEGTDVRN